MDIEVLIYINTVKEYFKKHPDFYDYIIGDNSLDYFYENVEKISTKNFKTKGEPRLDRNQFEILRKSRKIKNIFTYYIGDNVILN